MGVHSGRLILLPSRSCSMARFTQHRKQELGHPCELTHLQHECPGPTEQPVPLFGKVREDFPEGETFEQRLEVKNEEDVCGWGGCGAQIRPRKFPARGERVQGRGVKKRCHGKRKSWRSRNREKGKERDAGLE